MEKYLDVSTGNLPLDEFVELLEHGKVIANEHPYGTWVWVPPAVADDDVHDVTKELPALAHLFEVARKHNCDWINFDSDADLLAGAPHWEW